MMTMRKIARYLSIVAIVLIASCQHKELCYEHPHKANVRVGYEWPEGVENLPSTMSVYVYSTDTTDFIRYEFDNNTGGDILLPFGMYRFLSINSDTPNIEYTGRDSLETFIICASEASILDGTSIKTSKLPTLDEVGKERYLSSIDSLWCCEVKDSVIIDQSSIDDSTQLAHISFTPEYMTRNISVEITKVENADFATGGLSMSLSGLPAGICPFDGKFTEEAATYISTLKEGKTNKTLVGSINTFGVDKERPNKHYLIVYAILSDGTKWFYSYDVTDQLYSQPNSKKINISVSGLPIPSPLFNGGGINPDVDTWIYNDVPITM
jgi:hypothetical protein